MPRGRSEPDYARLLEEKKDAREKGKASASFTASDHAMLAEKPGLQAQAKFAELTASKVTQALDSLSNAEASEEEKSLALLLLEDGASGSLIMRLNFDHGCF